MEKEEEEEKTDVRRACFGNPGPPSSGAEVAETTGLSRWFFLVASREMLWRNEEGEATGSS